MEAAGAQNSSNALSHSGNIEMTASHEERDQISKLYEASERGDESVLESLIGKKSQILYKLSLAHFAQTPLHISSSLGHFKFTQKLLSHRSGSQLALERDYNQRTALHLASAQGYIRIVEELVNANKQPCLFADEEERIPLHYAAMRGRKEVVQMLIRAEPDSLKYRDNKNNNAFHLCVLYNQLETLKVLVELEREFDRELLNFTAIDNCGNTVLHIAVELNQVETIKYLLSEPKTRQIARLKNKYGLTAHDILEHSPKFFKTLEIRHMLINAGIDADGIEPIPPSTSEINNRGTENGHEESPPQPPSSTTTDQENGWRKILGILASTLKYEKTDWLEEMRGNFSLVAAMISTITFQAIINPPGGFVQQGIASAVNQADSGNETNSGNQTDTFQPFECAYFEDGISACPGDAVSAIKFPYFFHPYLKYNTISFIGSLCVILLVVSGVPLKHKAVIWMLSIGMCITLTFLSLSYLQGLHMVTPHGDLFGSAGSIFQVSFWSWIGFLGIVAVFSTLRFLFWLAKKSGKKYKRLVSRPRRGNENR